MNAAARRKADAKPTWTSLVLGALTKADDFLSLDQLMAATGANMNQVTASLHHLSKRHAVESVVGGDGKLWWFATPASDDRTKVVEQRIREPEGNRTRGRRVVKQKT